MPLHILHGCSPTPLANYLKALGILRLVSQQADPAIRGYWDGQAFCLLTSLSREELENFFLYRYAPTPLVAPWNKGSGFYNEDDPALTALGNSVAARFQIFRDGIVAARRLLDEIAQADGMSRALKACTKAGKSYRSGEQRLLIKEDQSYKSFLAKAMEQSGTQDQEIRDEEHADLEVLESLVRPEVTTLSNLKDCGVFKRLQAVVDRRFKEHKEQLLVNCKRSWRGPHAHWLSSAIVLDDKDEPNFPSILGTGGNDGRLDYTNNFMARLSELFDTESESGTPRQATSSLLAHALWGEPTKQMMKAAIGQYQPGAAGGANSSTGFVSGNMVNPWDFILMLEGTLTFVSRATKLLDPQAASKASAPFAVKPHGAGNNTLGDEKAQRGEQWMPLWNQPTTYTELVTLFGEGRVQIHRQVANRPIDMARAISRLGVARGVNSFVRYAYLERNGQANLAVPLGQIEVRVHPRAYLIDDLARWLDQLQLRSRDKNATGSLVQAERQLANAVFAALTQQDVPARWQSILLAASRVEELQARGTGAAVQAGPIPPLQPAWVRAVDDGSSEFRLALALGSAATGYASSGRAIDSVRHHWLPLALGARKLDTSGAGLYRVVAQGRSPLRDLAAVVQRRLIEASQKGQRRLNLIAAAGCGARLPDLAQFLAGNLDMTKLIGLARAFMALKWEQWQHRFSPRATGSSDDLPDDAWLAVRLANLAWPLTSNVDIPVDPQIVRLLTVGDTTRAVELAWRKLHAAGIRLPFQAAVADALRAAYWAAALAFPVHRDYIAEEAMLVLDPSKNLTSKTKGRSYV